MWTAGGESSSDGKGGREYNVRCFFLLAPELLALGALCFPLRCCGKLGGVDDTAEIVAIVETEVDDVSDDDVDVQGVTARARAEACIGVARNALS